MMMQTKTRGFTLIELMIVIAVLALLVGIGYPSYQDQVRKSRRAEGMGELLELAERMERFYTDRETYAGATLGAAATNIYPTTTDGGYYTLSIVSQDAVGLWVSSQFLKLVILGGLNNGSQTGKRLCHIAHQGFGQIGIKIVNREHLCHGLLAVFFGGAAIFNKKITGCLDIPFDHIPQVIAVLGNDQTGI